MKTCEKCGESFACGMQPGANSQEQKCWCQDLPLAPKLPAQFQDCLCPRCLQSFLTPPPLAEGDFYLNEQGLMVFTKQYHLKRGYCCGSGCKHCPYKESV